MKSSHYFTNDDVVSDPKIINYIHKGKKISFKTDNGVFSKSGVDFGSRLLIENFNAPELEGSILEVGCGYGPIGLCLASDYPNKKIDMVDVNLRAIELCKENAIKNNIKNTEVFASNLYESIDKKYSAIVSNPPIRAGKHVVHGVISEAYDYLEDDGTLMIVIQKKQGAPSAMNKMEEVYGNCEVITKDKGYYILKSTKR